MSGEKTEKPTEHRLLEARKKGQLARSRLFNAAAVTAGGWLGFSAAGVPQRLKAWTVQMLAEPHLSPSQAASQAVVMLAQLTLPTLVGAYLASLGVSVAAAGLQVHAGHVAPQLDRVDPFKGLKRLFSASQLIEVGKGLLVTALVAGVVVRAFEAAAFEIVSSVSRGGVLAMSVALAAVTPALSKGALTLLALGVGDYALSRRKHLKELMMSRHDVKQEHKNQEGDPHHKAQRKHLHQQISMGGPARGVQKATAVVVNPTHIAIALRYDESECDAPYVVAKGCEEDALKLKRQAGELEIPIVKDVPLARSLVHYDVGEQVPEELYQAAAAVLKVAMERRAERAAAKGGA